MRDASASSQSVQVPARVQTACELVQNVQTDGADAGHGDQSQNPKPKARTEVYMLQDP